MAEHAHMHAKLISCQGSGDTWGFIIALGTSHSSYGPSLRSFGIPNPLRFSSVLASFWQTSGSLPSDVCPGAINKAFCDVPTEIPTFHVLHLLPFYAFL